MLINIPKQQSRKREKGKETIMKNRFKHPECNGWIVVDKDQIIGGSPRNYHVVEVNIIDQEGGKLSIYINSANETCCGLKVKNPCHYKLLSRDEKILRKELAEMQNSGNETCGNCVGHFYADPEV